MALDHRQVEPGEMEDLGDRRVGQQPAQIGRGIVAIGEMHHMGIAVAAGKLQHAQPVAPQVQAHGLGVDGDAVGEHKPAGKIVAVIGYGHDPAPLSLSYVIL